MQKSSNGFTMIELLIALAILAVVVGVISPVFFGGLQGKARDIVAKNMAADLNNTYAEWINAGGQVTGAAPATSNGILAMNGTDSSDFKNGGSSLNFKFPVPSSVLSSLSTSNPQSVIEVNGVALAFDPTSHSFAAVTLPTDGTAVQVGQYIAAADPSTGAFSFAAIPSFGTFTSVGSTLVATDSSGHVQLINEGTAANAAALALADNQANATSNGPGAGVAIGAGGSDEDASSDDSGFVPNATSNGAGAGIPIGDGDSDEDAGSDDSSN